MAAMCRHKVPALSFPLKQMKKVEAYDALPQNVREIVTWCENADHDNCRYCGSCSRMLHDVGERAFPRTAEVIELKKQIDAVAEVERATQV